MLDAQFEIMQYVRRISLVGKTHAHVWISERDVHAALVIHATSGSLHPTNFCLEEMD